MRIDLLLASLAIACHPVAAADMEVVVSPRVTLAARPGITGAGSVVKAGDRALSFFPDHPDDFGGSKGMASAISQDGGLTWTKGPDNWPMPGMVSLWADRLKSGDLLAFGIHWLPDPAKRRDPNPQRAPDDAYQIGISKDGGRNWNVVRATIDCPPEVGYIARPLPHIIEDENGRLLMPAYTWSNRGNKVALLQSDNGGRHWKFRSVITTAVAMIQAGARVTTPWLESTVSPTRDGDLLAIVRTGSTIKSALVSVRSDDGGKSWSAPRPLSFAGKLPTLHLLNNGVLTLTTALSRNHCRIYLSTDGTGRSWGKARVISSLTGGNVGVTVAGDNQLLLTSPANRRIDAWSVRIDPPAKRAAGLKPPTQVAMKKGILSWKPAPNATAYRITPILIKPGKLYPDTGILPYAATQTRDATPRLEVRRQLLIGSAYAFELRSVDAEGRVSPPFRSQEIQF